MPWWIWLILAWLFIVLWTLAILASGKDTDSEREIQARLRHGEFKD